MAPVTVPEKETVPVMVPVMAPEKESVLEKVMAPVKVQVKVMVPEKVLTGSSFSGWTATSGTIVHDASGATNQFIMPNSDATVTATFTRE